MSNDVPLREFVESKFEVVESQLREIKDALNHLSLNMVSTKRFDSKMHSVKELQAAMKEQDARDDKQDERIAHVEFFQLVLKYIGGLAATILVAVIIAWLTGLI